MITSIQTKEYGELEISRNLQTKNGIVFEQDIYPDTDPFDLDGIPDHHTLYLSYCDIPNLIKELEFLYKGWRG